MPAKANKPSDQLKVALLWKFYTKRAFAKYHIYESDIAKGFPQALRVSIMETANELYREGLLVHFPHGGEHVWQINRARIAEVIALLKKYYPELR